MKLPQIHTPSAGTLRRGFTMVEIALCLGIIGIALVAIIGVMPTGLKVQRENREETIINQDGQFLVNAIRNGRQLIEELTNHVEDVTISNLNNRTSVTITTPSLMVALRNGVERPSQVLLGLLSTPKYVHVTSNSVAIREVRANVRAIAGSAIGRDPANSEVAFRYEVQSELVPFQPLPPEVQQFAVAGLNTNSQALLYQNFLYSTNLSANFYELRLTFRWPLIRRGNGWVPGGNEKTFSTLVNGQVLWDSRTLGGLPGLPDRYFMQQALHTQVQVPGPRR